jgi:hypothetical protein
MDAIMADNPINAGDLMKESLEFFKATNPFNPFTRPEVVCFMGQNVDEMSRDDLINVVKLLGRQLEAIRSAAKQSIEIVDALAKAKSARSA